MSLTKKMSLSKRISPYFTQAVSSERLLKLRRSAQEFNRKRRGLPHEVSFYHKVDDPYCYLLLQMLQRLMSDFDIKVKPHIVSELSKDMFPEPELLKAWSLKDAKLLAQAFNLEFPDIHQLPPAQLCKRAEKILLSNEQSDSFLKFAIDVNKALWSEGEAAIKTLEEEVGQLSDEQRQKLVEKSNQHLKKKGHYLSATMYYGGEWFWGVDRVYHLAQRLLALGIAKDEINLDDYDYPKPASSQNKPSKAQALDFYFSFRSPYSYLACQRLLDLNKKLNLSLNVKPVLPMVMRGLPVPAAKRMYIFLDTKRECARYGIPFGKTVDPLGEGVNRCMAIFPYAQQQHKTLEYIASISKGIWAEGQDVTEDDLLEKLVTRSGLDWNEAEKFLNDKSWEKSAEQNRKDMIALGFWGVPTFQYGDFSCWGQDRLWAIEQKILSRT